MKINWKVRFNNPQFWINLAISIFAIILAYFGLNWSQMTTWSSIGVILIDAVKNPVVVFAILSCIWNALNDPTTKGLSDSRKALTYDNPK